MATQNLLQRLDQASETTGSSVAGALQISLGVGVAIAAAAAGENVRVCIRGMISANVVSTVAQGDRLVSSSTAGRAEVAPEFRTDLGDGTGTTTGTVAQQRSILAVAVSIATSNIATVYVFPKF